MAVVDYQQRNRDNLQTLIKYMKDQGSKGPYEIGYSESQTGQVILLGKGHSAADKQTVKGGYKGKIELQEVTAGSILVTIKPQGEQKGGRLQLQMYVRQAIENLASPYAGHNWLVSNTTWV